MTFDKGWSYLNEYLWLIIKHVNKKSKKMHLKMRKIAFALRALSFMWPAPMQIYWIPQGLDSNMAAISLFWNPNMP